MLPLLSIFLIHLQEEECSEDRSNCVKAIEVDPDLCMSPCSGLILTSLSKSESNNNVEMLNVSVVKAYDKYMKWFHFPSELKGENN